MAERPSSPHASDRARRRRRAAERLTQGAAILVCECRDDGETPIRDAVRALGFETLACGSLEDALREADRTPFDVVITVLAQLTAEHERLLQLLRRSLASTPIVIVCEDDSIEARARCQPIRPYYFAVPPLPEQELRAVLAGAVEAARRR